jgi:hypothetical protein
MGCLDSVLVRCPTCGTSSEFQSKGGDCLLRVCRLENCPHDVLSDVNRHAPNQYEQCNTSFRGVQRRHPDRTGRAATPGQIGVITLRGYNTSRHSYLLRRLTLRSMHHTLNMC